MTTDPLAADFESVIVSITTEHAVMAFYLRSTPPSG